MAEESKLVDKLQLVSREEFEVLKKMVYKQEKILKKLSKKKTKYNKKKTRYIR